MAHGFDWTRVHMEDFWKNMIQVLDCFNVTSSVSEMDGCLSELYYAKYYDAYGVKEACVFCLIHNLRRQYDSQPTWEYYVNETNLTLLAAIAAVESLDAC